MAAESSTAPENPPSASLYIRNLDESVKIPILKDSLEAVFSQYGKILDIVAHKNLRMRGQAFVVFDNLKSSELAMEEVQGFDLFEKEKPMEIHYAKSASDATIKQTGDEAALENHKQHRLEEKERKKLELEALAKKRKRIGAVAGRNAKRMATSLADELLPPNKILFLQNLPDDITSDQLTAVFDKFPGFFEVRLVPGRKGIAFVEYFADDEAVVAKEGTHELEFSDKKTRITFARK
ncbi:uncharacterized protein V1518DRAFT_49204 [Limtongia smithiae]|uniref:uncharacterized protein n=1 Tax=Limtongia smithiae TaxID=1125753 RepID=UPI0034CECF68